MTGTSRTGNGDKLSPRTLAIASVASATAALITSRLWAPGTALAAALTPVIVSIVSELLERPAGHVSRLRASRRAASPARSGSPGYERPRARKDALESLKRQANRLSGRRRLHLKIALATGAVAFVIATLALTVPELIFGKAVATNRHTTIFGGTPPGEQPTQPTQRAPQQTETAPSEKPPPETTGPSRSAPTNTQPPPSQTPPAKQTTRTP